MVRITPFSQPADLDDTLAGLGYRMFDDTRVLAAHLHAMDLSAQLPTDARLRHAEADEFARVVGQLRGSPSEQQDAHAQRLKQSPVPYQGWILQRGQAVLACGQYAREGSHVGLYDIYTAPKARNQGLSRALCADLLRRAAAEGAQTAYLQVDAANAPALAVYRKLGFEPGYSYHYRSTDPAAAV